MKSEPKPLVRNTNKPKRTYVKPVLRVYGTVGEITAAVSAQKMNDGARTAAMSSTH
jgi:hypothetical protein